MTAPDDLERRLAETPTSALRAMVQDASSTVAAIEAELHRREEHEQNLEIDQLEEHLANAKPKWGEVKAFFDLVLKELRK